MVDSRGSGELFYYGRGPTLGAPALCIHFYYGGMILCCFVLPGTSIPLLAAYSGFIKPGRQRLPPSYKASPAFIPADLRGRGASEAQPFFLKGTLIGRYQLRNTPSRFTP